MTGQGCASLRMLEARRCQADSHSTWLTNHPNAGGLQALRQREVLARRTHRTLLEADWERVTDPRDARGRQHSFVGLLQLMVLGMASGSRALRDVEQLGKELYYKRKFRLRKAPSDTTLYRTVVQASSEELGEVLASTVHRMRRAKQLEPDPEIGISLVAVDGKRFGTGRTATHAESVVGGSGERTYYQVHALRAVLVSTAVKPALAQQVVRRSEHEGEARAFPSFLEKLLQTYGGLVECVSMDAGFVSMPNLLRMNREGVGYILAVKNNAARVRAWAAARLGEGSEAPRSGWAVVRTEGRGTSREITRSFSRVRAELSSIGWQGVATEVWRVHQSGVRDGVQFTEDRYFLTNLVPGRLTDAQALAAVRAHWGIENGSNWVMDTQLDEDTVTWVNQGSASEVLAMLRLIAYNLLQLCRNRALRAASNRAVPWRTLLLWMRDALVNPVSVWEPDGVG